MHRERTHLNRERHERAVWYLIVSLALATCAYLFFGFDRAQTLGYGVSCFVMLNIVNFRAMFRRIPTKSANERRQPNS